MLLVLLLVAVLPLKQHPFWNGSAGEYSLFTAAKYLGGACAAYAAIYLALRGRIPSYISTWQARFYSLFLLLVYLSSLHSGSSLSTFDPLLGPGSLLILCFVLQSVVDSIRRLRSVLLVAVGSLGWASLYVLREWQKVRGWETGYRAGWIVGDANHFGISAIFGIALAWYLAQDRKSGWQRWFCWTCMLLTLVATIAAGASRGGLLGLVTSVLYWTVRARRGRLAVVTILGVLIMFNFVYPHSPLQRLLNPDPNDKGSELAHRASWEAGLKMIREHPFVGIGIAAFKPQMDNYRPDWYDGPAFMAHNAYISVAAEIGIPGLLLFVSTLIATYVSLEQMYRRHSTLPLIRQAAIGLQAGLVGNIVAISFVSAEHHEHLWMTVFLSMCLPPLVSRVARARANSVARIQKGVTALGEPVTS